MFLIVPERFDLLNNSNLLQEQIPDLYSETIKIHIQFFCEEREYLYLPL